MARNEILFNTRNETIILEYNELSKQPKYKNKDWLVYRFLRAKYFLTNRTIYHILSGNYNKVKAPKINPNQMTIHDISGVWN